MKTSALLLDESGNRIDDWCACFSAAPHPDHPDDPAMATVVHSFLIEGHLEDFHQTPLADFVRVIEQPFVIDAVERLYLNSDCLYDEGMIEALAHFTRTHEAVPVALVPILPTELDGAGLMLDRMTLDAFGRGHPIWRRGALSCAPGRGERGRSGASDLLRNAIRSWTVVSEQTVRHAFTRAQNAGKAFCNRNTDLTRIPKEMVEYFLGYYPSGALADTAVPDKNVTRLAMNSFKFENTHSEGRDNLFPGQGASIADRRACFYGDSAEIVSAQIESNIEHFERLNPGCRFDALAIASWNLRILLWLRLAYSLAMSMDAKRSAARRELLEAATPEQREDVARRFTQTAYHGVKAVRRTSRRKATRVLNEGLENVFVSHIDLATTSETALVAFFADVDPRTIRAQLYPFALEDQEALFTMARWLGNLHRHRQGYLTPHEAESYLYLLERIIRPATGDDETAERETQEIGFAVGMIGSFMMPVGLLRLKEAATATSKDGVGRTIYAVDPDYDGARARQALEGAPGLAALRSDHGMGAIPLPTLVPAGRLLIPGDYTEAWAGRCSDLLGVLQEE